VKEQLAGWAYAAGWGLVRAVPRRVAAAGFRAGADYVTRRGGRGVTRLRANLSRVVGPDATPAELDLLVRDAMRSYLRYWMEAFRLPGLTPRQRVDSFQLVDDDEQRLADAVALGKGVVLVLPHAGNWDAAGAYVVGHGWPLITVQERLKPEKVFQRFLEFRESIGMEILPLSGGERPPLDVLTEKLGQGYVVPLLAERDMSARGVEVTFFGGRTRMPAGPAVLAMRTGAPTFTVDLWYEEDGPKGHIRGPLELPTEGALDERVRAATQLFADSMAAGIAEHPADWHMLQRMWLDEPVLADSTTAG
jgi:phosphatidylinositol dimannoside acyltransferase